MTLENVKKTTGSLTFSADLEMEHWYQKRYTFLFQSTEEKTFLDRRGYPFMTSSKNDQFFDTLTPAVHRSEQLIHCLKTKESAST